MSEYQFWHDDLFEDLDAEDKWLHEDLMGPETPSAEELAKKHDLPIEEIQAAIKQGEKIEMEHTNDRAMANEIARDHIAERPDYYERLKKVESKQFNFIRGELLEAKYIRIPRQVKGHTIADVGETFFEHVLALQQLRYENPEAAKKYAIDTLKYFDFSNVRSGATDLHNLASIVMNPSKFADELSGTGDGGSIPELQFKRWLRDIKNDKFNTAMDRQLLYRMEKQLNIKSGILKRMRRLAQDYAIATPGEKKQLASRLTLHFRQDRRFMSDIHKPWKSATKSLVPTPQQVNKAEKSGSGVPGWVKTAAAIAAGAYVGAKVAPAFV